jgi:HKD family nuclease
MEPARTTVHIIIMTSEERNLLEITARGLLKLEHNIHERVAMIELVLHALFRHKGNTELTLAWLQVKADVQRLKGSSSPHLEAFLQQCAVDRSE